jgi:hypothetical protein
MPGANPRPNQQLIGSPKRGIQDQLLDLKPSLPSFLPPTPKFWYISHQAWFSSIIHSEFVRELLILTIIG